MLTIIGLIFVIVATFFTYKTAKTNGRTGLWALATFGIGIALQIVLPVLVGIIVAVYYVAMGLPTEDLSRSIEGAALSLGFVALILSFVGMFLVLRHVIQPLDEPLDLLPPPPPII